MGKSDEKQTKKRAWKATCESKHKNKPSFDETAFEATDFEGAHHSQWCDLFGQFCDYKAKVGHCRMPRRYAANPKLGRWVSRQRCEYRKKREGKSSPMTEERIRALNGISFDWKTSKPWSVRFQQATCESKHKNKPSFDETAFEATDFEGAHHSQWCDLFGQFCDYKAKVGHCRMPRRYAANPKLGRWVSRQRCEYRKKREGKSSPMTEERIRALNDIGFDWGISKPWSVRFQQLCDYKVQFGHCLVPEQYSASPKLGKWVSTQRRNYRFYQEGKPSAMTEEHIHELESLGFV